MNSTKGKISVNNFCKTYEDGKNVLNNISFHVEPGEFIVIVGPSGCGKSTMLRMIAGLEAITSGDIEVDGEVINNLLPNQRDLAFVFQNYALYPHLSVRDNIAFSLEMRGVNKKERHAVAERVAKEVRLTDYLNSKPGQLSGGQRQRVAMGRAIARKANLLLMDEPLSNLDAELRNSMRVQIKEMQRRLGTTTLYVTHDQVEALTLADKIAVLNDGVLQQYATPDEIYDYPANIFVASFIGSPAINLFECSRHTDNQIIFNGIEGEFELKNCYDKNMKMGVRPYQVKSLSENEQTDVTLLTKVRLIETIGNDRLVYLTTSLGKELRMIISRHTKIEPNQELRVGFDLIDCHWFDSETEVRID